MGQLKAHPSLSSAPANRWFTSDLHFGHSNIIDYCNRPFGSVGAMDEWLIQAWNETVAPGDEVWVLGDVALGNVRRSLACVARLHGTLRLVVGNHDRPFRRTGVAHPEWEAAYLDAGFTSLHHDHVSLQIGTVPVLACHFPPFGDSQREDRFVGHRPANVAGWLLHGHVHDTWRQREQMINVGVDVWAGRPVAEATIAELIAAGPASRDALTWPQVAVDGSTLTGVSGAVLNGAARVVESA
jgi:calcineurin-like phosphoesterase family protein